MQAHDDEPNFRPDVGARLGCWYMLDQCAWLFITPKPLVFSLLYSKPVIRVLLSQIHHLVFIDINPPVANLLS